MLLLRGKKIPTGRRARNIERNPYLGAPTSVFVMSILDGSGVAVITPFTSTAEIDFPALEKVIEHLIGNNINYLVVLGTTGESATLSPSERKAVFSFFAEKVNGRVPLIAGHGGNNTAALVEEIKTFDRSGYSAILSASPHYNKPNQEGIYQHYRAVAEASELPIVLYNVPSRTGSLVSAETTVRLANEFSNIIGTKEASGNFDQLNQIIRDKPKGFKLVSGDDPITLPMMAMGATGVISVVGNAFPKQVAELVNLCAQNKFAEAQHIQSALVDFTRLLFADGSPAGVKTAMHEIGLCEETLRLPLTGVSFPIAERIRKEVSQLK